MRLTLAEYALIVVIIFVSTTIAITPRYACERQAKLMNMRHDWTFLYGCMIEPKPGQWVPLKYYRVM